MSDSTNLVVTISRQLGSGGGHVGRLVARELDAFYADRAIIREAAEKLSVKEETVAEREEAMPSFWRAFLSSACVYPDMYVPPVMLMPTDHDFFMVESEIITRMAQERRSVIIGRCGFHVLRDHPGRVSVFLHADRAFRVSRYQRISKTTAGEAEKMVDTCDKERANYCRNYTGCEQADATNYDLSIDTSRLKTLDQAVRLILSYITMRQDD